MGMVDGYEWAGWTILPTLTVGGEEWDRLERVVRICPEPDARSAVAHVRAHLDLRHHAEAESGFTQAQEDAADLWAELMLDPQWQNVDRRVCFEVDQVRLRDRERDVS